MNADFSTLLLGMGAAAIICRFTGFTLMRFVPVTPRVEAALRATPLAVMVGMVMPAAATGRIPEIVGLATAVVVMRLVKSDLTAALAGVAALVFCRHLGLF